MGPLICLYLIFIVQQEIDVVEGIHQTVLLVRVDFELLAVTGCQVGDCLVGHIDLDLGLWVGSDAGEEFLLERW